MGRVRPRFTGVGEGLGGRFEVLPRTQLLLWGSTSKLPRGPLRSRFIGFSPGPSRVNKLVGTLQPSRGRGVGRARRPGSDPAHLELISQGRVRPRFPGVGEGQVVPPEGFPTIPKEHFCGPPGPLLPQYIGASPGLSAVNKLVGTLQPSRGRGVGCAGRPGSDPAHWDLISMERVNKLVGTLQPSREGGVGAPSDRGLTRPGPG